MLFNRNFCYLNHTEYFFNYFYILANVLGQVSEKLFLTFVEFSHFTYSILLNPILRWDANNTAYFNETFVLGEYLFVLILPEDSLYHGYFTFFNFSFWLLRFNEMYIFSLFLSWLKIFLPFSFLTIFL